MLGVTNMATAARAGFMTVRVREARCRSGDFIKITATGSV